MQSIVISMSVCLSARITQKPHGRTLPNFMCMLPVAVDRSFSNGVGIRYVLPSLRITSGQVAKIEHEIMFRRMSPGGGTSWTSDYSV